MTNNNSLNGETYFSFEDDTAKKQLKITGLVDHPGSAAGTISGYIMGASSGNMANVKVFVEYDLELSLFRDKGENQNHLTILPNEEPDTEKIKQFTIKYYPIDLDIDILDENHTLVCIPYEQNELKDEQALILFHNIEMPLVEVLTDMELTGIRVDKKALKAVLCAEKLG